MKIIVLVQNYPNNSGGKSLMYVHVRNRFYAENGIDVTVLNFAANNIYDYDGIHVISEKDFYKSSSVYDAAILHAPNLKNHFRFLVRNASKFKHFVFFFHGHEILILSKEYPKAYPFIKNNIFQIKLRDLYDIFKLKIWHYFFSKNMNKSDFVVVSHWLENKFYENLKLDPQVFSARVHVIYNSVGSAFENNNYDYTTPKKYDFITIRNRLDSSTYCIDIVNSLAKNNQNCTFLIIGEGTYFMHYEKSPNITWVNKTLTHQEILQYLDESRCALMPTRNDTQGVMSCEMATYGMPLITSNISICKEVFEKYNCVYLMDNSDLQINLCEIQQELFKRLPNQKQYCASQTIKHELDLICNLK